MCAVRKRVGADESGNTDAALFAGRVFYI